MQVGRPMGPMAIVASTYRKYTHLDTKLPDHVKNTAVNVTISQTARELAKASQPDGNALKPKMPKLGE